MASFSRSLCSPLVLFIIFLSFSEARDHLIGGKSDAWKVPSSESDSLNHWAEKTRFQVGDSLVWKFDGSKDSVLQVAKRDYVTCNTSSPLETYTDGNTKVKLERSGPYYFISGAEGHCEKGQKVIVVVMSEKHSRFIGVSPAPSPAEVEGPAVAPTSNAANLKGSFLVAMGAFVGFLLI
ncbi:early nodulin-like protein 1 [Olea europaea var. sylvestris]|uniref:early nodulin-like protein 1 n=1 Tax=Olea europaea var. sylvestris TaxID=158386 RepID=UPI000C1CF2BD|nr:early nodulin-like protein 1 [Olea europaea var. sylvestris]